MAFIYLVCYSLIYYMILASGVDCRQPPYGLQARLFEEKLPLGLSFFSSQAVFDGTDSIYVMGGYNSDVEEHCTILRYSISADVIKCVANMTGESHGQGTANLGKNGKIYFTSRQNGPHDIIEFDPLTNQVRGLEIPMSNKGFMYSAVTNSGSLILVYWIGNNSTVYEWHINATTYRTVGQLPFNMWSGSSHYLPDSNQVLIVGSYLESRTMALLDVETGQTKILPSINWSISFGLDVVVKDEFFRFGQVQGRVPNRFLWYAGFADDSTVPHQEMVEIRNFPHGSLFWQYTGAYVPQLNRVYMFGGYIQNGGGYVTDIWYVDLGTR